MKSEKILKKYCREDGTISLSFVGKKDLHFFDRTNVERICNKHNISYSIVCEIITPENRKPFKLIYGTVIAMQDFIVINNELMIFHDKINRKIKNNILFKSKIKKSLDWFIKAYYPSLDVKIINRLEFSEFKRSNTLKYMIYSYKYSVENFYSYYVANGWEYFPTEYSEFKTFKEKAKPFRDELLEIWSLPSGPTEIIDFSGCKSLTNVSVHLPLLTLKAKPHLRSERIKNTVNEALSNAGFSGIADNFSAKAENNEDLLLLASEYVQLTIEVKS